MVITSDGVALGRVFGSADEIDDQRGVVLGPLVGAGRSVTPHVGGHVGDDRRAEGEVNAKSVVLIELAGSIVPPRELGCVGVTIAGKVDEPEFEQPSDGIAFGWAGVGASSPARRVEDITLSGGGVDVAGHDRVTLGDPVLLKLTAEAFEPHEFVEVVRVVERASVGNVDRPAPDTSAGRGDEAGLIERGRD